MIVSASYRTDIPAFYGRWFLRRLAAGSCRVANPYGGKAYEVRLDTAEGFVFWTRNARPFGDALDAVAARDTPFVLQFTVTGYPRALESAVPRPEDAAAQIRALARRFGPRAVVWRHDPVVISSLTPPAWQRENFARLAARLAGAVDEVVISFAHIYRKSARNLDRAALRHGFAWRDPAAAEKRVLALDLADIAAAQGMRLTLCAQPDLVPDPADTAGALVPAACIDAGRLSDIAGRPIAARRKGNRPGCLCDESRDIGAYDTCPQGCAYCYAVRSRPLAKRRARAHDAEAPSLSPPPSPTPGSLTQSRD